MLPEQQSIDLSFVDSKDLIAELECRADAMVLGFDPKGNKEDTFYTNSLGDVLTCSGLMRKLAMQTDDRLRGSTISTETESETSV